MPITKIDPLGGVEVKAYNIEFYPEPKDANVRIWVDGKEQFFSKVVGVHIENPNNPSVQFWLDDVLYERVQQGYMNDDEYYYIRCPMESKVTYQITQSGCFPVMETVIVGSHIMKSFKLVDTAPLLTIVPSEGDAQVTLINGSEVVTGIGTTSIQVSPNDTVHYRVEKTNFFTVEDDVTVEDTKLLNIPLIEACTVTAILDPITADIILKCGDYVQIGNSITVPINSEVHWEASAMDYLPKTGVEAVYSTHSFYVTLDADNLDARYINEALDSFKDAGKTTETVEEIKDAGNVRD